MQIVLPKAIILCLRRNSDAISMKFGFSLAELVLQTVQRKGTRAQLIKR